MKKLLYVSIILIASMVCSTAWAVTYYVRTDGSNGNTGLVNSAGGAWRTITYAEATLSRSSEDAIVRVQAGTYDEDVTINVAASGTRWITFIGEGVTRPITKKFSISGTSRIRIINFEIRHTDNTINGAIVGEGTTSYIEIIDNYIHNVRGASSGGESAVIYTTGTPTYWTLRGNTIYYVGWITGVWDNSNTAAVQSQFTTSNHWLIEYNEMQRCPDTMYTFGSNHIIRNNYMHDVSSAYWTMGTMHVDFFQVGSDGMSAGTRYQIIENNLIADMTGIPLGEHFIILQDTFNDGDTDIVIRGNAVANMDSGIGIIGTDYVLAYNNSFYDMQVAVTATTYLQYSTASYNNRFQNNTIHTATNLYEGGTISVDTGTCTTSHNIGYNAGSETSYISTSDPLYVSPASPNRNFRLQSTSSPAYNTGTALVTITSTSGSGTSFNVQSNQGKLLTDGKGITTGDVVTINGTTTRVTLVSGDTIGVANSVSWTKDVTPVYWGPYGRVDVGAFPFGSTELTAATYTQVGNVYTVTPVGDARGVWFYVDGIPTTWDADAPYTATIASGTVTVKAYALYAQKVPVVTATLGASVPSATGCTISGGTFR